MLQVGATGIEEEEEEENMKKAMSNETIPVYGPSKASNRRRLVSRSIYVHVTCNPSEDLYFGDITPCSPVWV
jgi:hypothetical protein